MPHGLWGLRYLALAREDLSNFVEGRALRTKGVEGICKFLLEDVISRYGSVGRIRVDRGDLNAHEAREFFERYGVKLRLTTAMNPEGIVYDNATYALRELDGTPLRIPVAGKRVKLFKKREGIAGELSDFLGVYLLPQENEEEEDDLEENIV
ncbi:hypothetical protein R1sor_023480 [Riccia sorocarpa]|uniref:Uncharacterized protein n=1 Tax=Riccia sorocarpa TaxID=122646 RepID=A0ABD3GTS0_9MARC